MQGLVLQYVFRAPTLQEYRRATNCFVGEKDIVAMPCSRSTFYIGSFVSFAIGFIIVLYKVNFIYTYLCKDFVIINVIGQAFKLS